MYIGVGLQAKICSWEHNGLKVNNLWHFDTANSPMAIGISPYALMLSCKLNPFKLLESGLKVGNRLAQHVSVKQLECILGG